MRDILRWSISGILALALVPVSVAPVVAAPQAPAVGETLPVVAIHVSEYTTALRGTPGRPGPSSDRRSWYYDSFMHFQVTQMLEEALRGDGTPFVEVTDHDIESGDLLDDGVPRYPVVFSLMAESTSDLESNRLRDYVEAGGTVFGSGSSWTRRQDGSWRLDDQGRVSAALLSQVGLQPVTTGAAPVSGTWSWSEVDRIRRASDDALVSHLPAGADVVWPLPKSFDRGAYDLWYTDRGMHPVWTTRAVTGSAAQVLVTMPAPSGSGSQPAVALARARLGEGSVVYAAEMAPLAGWGGFVSDTWAYATFRKVVEQAFSARNLPLVRLATWRYPYRAALQTRWDMDFYPGDVRGLVPIEQAHGVRGQYYFVTSLAEKDDGNWVKWASQQGALVGSHNRVHVGPDSLTSTVADSDLHASFDALQGWTGTRPDMFVAPKYDGILDATYAVEDRQGAATGGEQNFGPFPHYALSMLESRKHFRILQLPSSEWLPMSMSNPDARSRMELMSDGSMPQLLDFYAGLGGLVSVVGHPYSTNRTRLQALLDAAALRPDVWRTDAQKVAAWWGQRDGVSIVPRATSADGSVTVNVSLSGSNDPATAVDVVPPGFSAGRPQGLRVWVDGVETDQYTVGASGVKVKVGTGSLLTVMYGGDPVDTPPAPPTGVAVRDLRSGGSLELTWIRPTDTDYSHAHVYRSTVASPTYELVRDSATSPFVDSGLVDGREYRYLVRSVDAAGNESGDSAVVSATPTSPSASGRWALGFDADDGVVVPYSPALDATGALTVEAFINLTTMPAKSGIIASRVQGTDRSWELYYDYNGRVLFYVRRPDDMGYVQAITPIGTLRPGAWHHVAGVVDPDADTVAVYVDGVRRTQLGWTYAGPRRGTAPLGINAEASGSSVLWAGDAVIDEVRVSRTARYTSGFAIPIAEFKPDARCVALYHFSEGAGSMARDATASRNDGAFRGDPVWSLGYPLSSEGTTAPPPSGDDTTTPPPGGDTTTTPPPSDDGTPTAPRSYAIRLDSSGDMVRVPYSPALEATGAMTVEMRVRPDDLPPSGTYAILASRWEGTATTWSLYYGSDGRVYFLTKATAGAQVQAITAAGVLTPGAWHHVAGVVDPATAQLRLYVDGTRAAYKAFPAAGLLGSNASLGVNCAVSGAGGVNLGDATFDDLRLSSVARYGGAAVSVPASPLPVDGTTLALWRFDEGSGASAADSGPAALTGALLGDPEWEVK